MQTEKFSNKNSDSQSSFIKSIDWQRLFDSSLCTQLMSVFFALIKNAFFNPSLSQLFQLPSHCLQFYQQQTQDSNQSFFQKIQAFIRCLGMFFSPLWAVFSSLVSLIALVILTIFTALAMVLTALSKVFIETIASLFRFKLPKNAFSYFAELSQYFLFKAPSAFCQYAYQAAKNYFFPSKQPAEGQQSAALNVSGLLSFLMQQKNVTELFTVIKKYQKALSDKGLSLNSLLDASQRPLAFLALIDLFATEPAQSPLVTTLAQAIDILINTAGTPDSIQQILEVMLAEFLATASQAATTSSGPTQEQPAATMSEVEKKFAPNFVGLKTQEVLDAQPASALQLIQSQTLSLRDMLEIGMTLNAPRARTASIEAMIQQVCGVIADLHGRAAEVPAATMITIIDQARLAFTQAQTPADYEHLIENAFAQMISSMDLPHDLSLSQEQISIFNAQKNFFQKELMHFLSSERAVFSSEIYQHIRSNIEHSDTPSITEALKTVKGQLTTPSMIRNLAQRVSLLPEHQKSFVLDLVIAELFPSFDVRRKTIGLSKTQEQQAIRFNQARSDEKNQLKNALSLLAQHADSPCAVLENVDSALITTMRQPQHKDYFRVLIAQALYHSYGYTHQNILDDQQKHRQAGLLSAAIVDKKDDDLERNWAVPAAMGEHFCDNIAQYLLTQDDLSSDDLLSLARQIFALNTQSHQFNPNLNQMITMIFAGKNGQPYHHGFVDGFINQNPAAFIRFAVKTLLKAIPPRDSQKHELIEDQLTAIIWKSFSQNNHERNRQITDLCEAIVDAQQGLKQKNNAMLRQAARKITPVLSTLISQLPTCQIADTQHGLSYYMQDLDAKIMQIFPGQSLPHLGTLAYLHQYAQPYGLGFDTVAPLALTAWSSYDVAKDYSTTLISKGYHCAQEIGQYSSALYSQLNQRLFKDNGLVAGIAQVVQPYQQAATDYAAQGCAYAMSWKNYLMACVLSSFVKPQAEKAQKKNEDTAAPAVSLIGLMQLGVLLFSQGLSLSPKNREQAARPSYF